MSKAMQALKDFLTASPSVVYPDEVLELLQPVERENVKLRKLALEIWRSCPVSEDDCAKCPHYIEESEEVSCDIPILMEKLGVEVYA